MKSSLSVIVPLGPGERAWTSLVTDLRASIPGGLLEWRSLEIVWVIPRGVQYDIATLEECCKMLRGLGWGARIVDAPRGRGRQLNAGARASTGEVLFFLHADSRFEPRIFKVLAESLSARPGMLHYFGLRFYDGPRAMWINTCGVWIRSRLMGIPYGDQGFAMTRKIHESLGGFDEHLLREEDHDYVWRAREKGIRLAPTGAVLRTSARKYSEHGWARITALYGYLTFRRAIPAWVKFVFRRDGGLE